MKIPFKILQQAHNALAVGGAVAGSYMGFSEVNNVAKKLDKPQKLYDYAFYSIWGASMGAGAGYLSPIIVPTAAVWWMTH